MKLIGSTALVFLLHAVCHTQNLPDRHLILDPLADRSLDSAGYTWLGGTRLYAEFSRYSNGSGRDHRWNAKTGGFIDIVRWDSSWSIALMGTMELVADPLNDITFNPRAIFWEEGVIASRGLPGDMALQFGYMHRCKHDVDNIEPYLLRNEIEQRTLIFSSITARLLARRRPIGGPDLPLQVAFALRNDFYMHLLDDRARPETRGIGLDIESLVNSTSVTARLELRPPGGRYGLHLSASLMASLFGSERGFSERFTGIRVLGAVPFVEAGFDLVNPHGGSLTIFARGEWQRDAAILTVPVPGRLFMIGLRMTEFETIW